VRAAEVLQELVEAPEPIQRVADDPDLRPAVVALRHAVGFHVPIDQDRLPVALRGDGAAQGAGAGARGEDDDGLEARG
jgi:hypothetical protein